MKEIIIPLSDVCRRCYDLPRLEIKDGLTTEYRCQCEFGQKWTLKNKEEATKLLTERLAEATEEIRYNNKLLEKIQTALNDVEASVTNEPETIPDSVVM